MQQIVGGRTGGWTALLATVLLLAPVTVCRAQAPAAPSSGEAADDLKARPPGKEAGPEAPAEKIDVKPTVSDEQIAKRLENILKATPDWFYEPNVEVQDGVAFLRGQTNTTERKAWAGELARSTEGVVAVVNLVDVSEPPVWDFTPAINGMYDLWKGSVRRSPWVVFCLIIIVLGYIAARLAERFFLWAFRNRFGSQLLRGVAAWIGGAAVFLCSLYIVLYVSGLTRLALTVLGGTGLIGLVLGIGFRDITENFLASIFLSVQTPFRTGDMVDINGIMGIVQRMTVRVTQLMTFEGNEVQIPNSIVYKSTLTNYTSSPNRRVDFIVGVAYGVDVSQAQTVAMTVLHDHPAVLDDPEPMVLAEGFASSSVTLRVYFWVNIEDHSWLKVRSAIVRQVKQAFADNDITIPFEMRELVFPRDVPVRMLEQAGRDGQSSHGERKPAARPAHQAVAPATQEGTMATSAEGGLSSEKKELKQEAERARPQEGEDLLQAADAEEEDAKDADEGAKRRAAERAPSSH